MPAEVFYHKDFRSSSEKSIYFTDFLSLNTQQLDLLGDFIVAVKFGDALKGKNKPSWTDTNNVNISSLALTYYKSCNLWHYHIGPFATHIVKTESKIRILNILGQTSSAIVHYKWYDPSTKKKLLIIAFSSVHNPFPDPKDINNPLSKRSGFIKSDDMISA